METKELKENAENIISHAGDYLDTFYKLTQARVTKKAADVMAGLMQTFLFCVAGLFVLLFAALGLAWWVGGMINSIAGGFSIVAVFFLLILACIYLLRKKIISPVKDLVVKKVYEADN